MADDSSPGVVPVELSKDDLLKYIELDLWGKFQERLWKVVGIVLTIISVVGLLGVPYYIKGEVSAALQKQTNDFKQRTDEIQGYAKLLATLTAQYEGERIRFNADIYQLISAVERQRAQSPTKTPVSRLNDPVFELSQLASRPDFSKIANDSWHSSFHLFSIPEELKGKGLIPPITYTIENKGFSGSGSFSEPHPVRNGTYEGSMRDLRFRIVTLEALRRSIEKLTDTLVKLGGATELEKRVESVRVKSIETTEFNSTFVKEVIDVADTFLNLDDKKAFARAQALYTLGVAVKYPLPAAPTQPTAVKKPGELSNRK